MIERKDIIPLLFILLLLVAIFVVFLDKRPFTDEGSFCTIAQAISNGSILYRDIYNEKSPLPYLFASLFINLSDNPITVLRIIASLLFLITTFMLYMFLRANQLNCRASTAIAAFYILSAPLFQSFNYTSEIVATPLILFIFNQMGEEDPGGINLITGFFTGLLFFIKQPFGIFVLIVLIMAIKSKNMRGFFITGFFTSLLLMYIVLQIKGIFAPFIDNLFFTMNRYDLSLYVRLPYKNEYFQFILLIIFVSAIFIRFSKGSIDISRFFLLLSLMIAGVLRMDAFKLLPFFTVLLYLYSSSLRIDRMRQILVIVLVLSIISIVNYKYILNQNFDGIKMISHIIQSKTGENESIWIGPHEANIYCLSKRMPSSKYFFLLPWISRPEVTRTLSEDLAKNDRPGCIVDVSRFNNETEYNLELIFPEFREIKKGYEDIQEINGAIIYCKE